MLRIRLQRTGRRNTPFFRMVVTDKKTAAKTGKFVEVIGAYDPKAGSVTVQEDRVKYWLENGAQPTGTVHNFLVDKGLISEKKINVLPQKTPVVSEKEATEEPAEQSSDEQADEPQEAEASEGEASDDTPSEEETEQAAA